MKLTDEQIAAIRDGAHVDERPHNCRFRQQEEGRSYPRLSCQACGRSVVSGLGTKCQQLIQSAARHAKDAEIATLAARVAELTRGRDAAIVALGEWARKAGALETRVAKLEEGLAQARTWHESEDKALSKSGRSDADYHWRLGGHADQIADIRMLLPDAEYHAALDRINACAALGRDKT